MTDRATPVVLLATAASHPTLTSDDRVFADALTRRGVTARAAVWNDPTIDWRAPAVVVRSTWDYFLRPDEFRAWAARVAAGALLQNAFPVIAWNAHKEYLATLQGRGVAIIETVFIPAGSAVDLAALARERDWGAVVVKPAVSAAAYETRRFDSGDRALAQSHLDRLVGADAMVQPYLARLSAQGELSVIFIGGAVSHAVRRRSAFAADERMPGAARVVAPAAAPRFAERVLAEATAEIGDAAFRSRPLLYARVDLAEREPGEWLLLELELIEPSLFFNHAPEAAERMADLLLRAL
jgi:hypothetical protein